MRKSSVKSNGMKMRPIFAQIFHTSHLSKIKPSPYDNPKSGGFKFRRQHYFFLMLVSPNVIIQKVNRPKKPQVKIFFIKITINYE